MLLRILAAEGAPAVTNHNPVPDWLQISAATAATLGALGVLAALATFWWQWRKAGDDRAQRDEHFAEDRRRYDAQMAALQRAEDDRIIAQARKIVPAVFPADLFGENMWTVKVSNTSTGVVTNLDVSVTAIDANGNEIPNGCRQANDQVKIGDGFRRLISDALSGSVTGALAASPASLFGGRAGGLNADQLRSVIDGRLGAGVSERFRDAMLGQLAREWMPTLTPGQFAVMAFKTVDRNARLRVVLEFEDEAGYRWRRPDDGQPVRIEETQG
jgi:hypothetical protein